MSGQVAFVQVVLVEVFDRANREVLFMLLDHPNVRFWGPVLLPRIFYLFNHQSYSHRAYGLRVLREAWLSPTPPLFFAISEPLNLLTCSKFSHCARI